MTIDGEALVAARAARARVDELERSLDLARANYQTAVRRLRDAGASLREIAGGLGVSHQRVHQIIEAATTDDRNVRSTSPIHSCDFCGGERLPGAPFVAGPGVGICGECVDATGRALEGTYRSPSGVVFARADPNSAQHCGFCKRRARQVNRLVSADETSICDECLTKCHTILTREAARGDRAAR